MHVCVYVSPLSSQGSGDHCTRGGGKSVRDIGCG